MNNTNWNESSEQENLNFNTTPNNQEDPRGEYVDFQEVESNMKRPLRVLKNDTDAISNAAWGENLASKRELKRLENELKENNSRKDYNEKINEHPKEILDGEFLGDTVLVRLHKFEFDTSEKGEVILPQYKEFVTEGGRNSSKLDDFIFQHRGVVVKLGTLVDKSKWPLNEGDVVWLNQRAVAPGVNFLHTRKAPAMDFEGYILISPASIQMIEKV